MGLGFQSWLQEADETRILVTVPLVVQTYFFPRFIIV